MDKTNTKLTKWSTNDNEIRLGPSAARIVEMVFEHPEYTQREIGKQLGVSEQRISKVLKSKRVLDSFPVLARRRLRGMVPKAMKKLNDLMNQTDNLEVSRKVVERTLDTAKVLENQPNVQTNVYISMKTDELKRVVDRTIEIPGNIVDGELADTEQ